MVVAIISIIIINNNHDNNLTNSHQTWHLPKVAYFNSKGGKLGGFAIFNSLRINPFCIGSCADGDAVGGTVCGDAVYEFSSFSACDHMMMLC